ncbi:hypothetical protein PR202_ga03551 [Eleusine coracana subsp. coracana]|uniref:Uncharacterized protein n=1 Tax=Eleusine coracana subsp. coracana TaxID=191504 RepID=A0AAV5BMF1_ELECO|nr:hypothetical protein PR202_ga03551 [Eleusine coracana subsp. coracana]
MLSVLAVVLLQLVKLALRPAAPRLPPGPWELPIIGSMHHLVNVLPHRALRDLAASLKDIHKTLDTIQQKIIDERKAIRDNKIKSGQTENVDENLVDVLIGLQEKGGFGFDLTNTIIKAIISYW